MCENVKHCGTTLVTAPVSKGVAYFTDFSISWRIAHSVHHFVSGSGLAILGILFLQSTG